MNDTRQTLAKRVNALIGPNKLFKSAPDLAQRAATMGLVSNVTNFTRSINRVRKGDTDVQLSTIEAIAKTANLRPSQLLESDRDSLSSIAAEIVSKLESSSAESAIAMLRGLQSAKKVENAQVLSPKKVVSEIRSRLGNQPPAAGASIYDPSLGTGDLLLQVAKWLEENGDKPATPELKSAFERWLSELKTSQKAVDTSAAESDATQQLINQTRAVASRGSATESAEGIGADDQSGREPAVKHR